MFDGCSGPDSDSDSDFGYGFEAQRYAFDTSADFCLNNLTNISMCISKVLETRVRQCGRVSVINFSGNAKFFNALPFN